MADDESTSIDTTAEEVVDTSVTSDDAANDDDVELEDIEVDPSDIESNDDEEEADSDESSEDTESEADTEDEPSEDEATSEEEAEPELSDEDKQKQHNREMAERRIQEKQAREERIRAAQAEYVAEAANSEDPLTAAVRQLEVQTYNNTVERNETLVKNEYQRAMNDFEVLRNPDPVVQQEINAAIDAFQAQYVQIDQFGNPVAVTGDLYATLQAKADSIEKLTGIRAQRQEQSKTKEKSKVLATPNRAPKQPKVDPDLAAFDEEAGL